VERSEAKGLLLALATQITKSFGRDTDKRKSNNLCKDSAATQSGDLRGFSEGNRESFFYMATGRRKQ